MINLMVAFLVLGTLQQPPAQNAKPRTELPLSAPTGWEMKEQDSTIVLIPKDLEAGKIYSVIAPGLPQKMGTVRGVQAGERAGRLENALRLGIRSRRRHADQGRQVPDGPGRRPQEG